MNDALSLQKQHQFANIFWNTNALQDACQYLLQHLFRIGDKANDSRNIGVSIVWANGHAANVRRIVNSNASG